MPYKSDKPYTNIYINLRWYRTTTRTNKNLGRYAYDPKPKSAASTILPLNCKLNDDRVNIPIKHDPINKTLC